MLVLGIETSCDETAASVVRDGRVLSSVVASQTELHELYGGVVPELASRAHLERIMPIVSRAIADAGVTLREIEGVAVGNRPGLIGSLLVGVAAAKALAWSLSVPLVGVDHVHAHLFAGMLGRAGAHGAGEGGPTSIEFPALGLVVSGGHTSLYLVQSWTEFKRLGATIDDAMGEAFDKAAVILGLPFPGGPNLDALAQKPGANDRAVELPVSRLGTESLDFSFSGLKTAMLYEVRGVPGKPDGAPPAMTETRRADLAASFQRAAVKAAIVKLERAIERGPRDAGGAYRAMIAGGGVTANSRLRRELAELATKRGLPLVIPAMSLCVDNAAMIAGLGEVKLAAGERSGWELAAAPTTGG
ncbi:MAG: tRNA (adenosine(37)-N6)-threonylcarbamoyltransferase complex transferase subunit TsaD [Phycisphaerales bacterium]|jgi:N6-L-threonylcarbamoyladenine synthase|nr:tRNA (adenosine(37)-N6)-threonylcarbamoyltransferase complex transferase subunit TsaD [Phycisphaerales bacterium]